MLYLNIKYKKKNKHIITTTTTTTYCIYMYDI